MNALFDSTPFDIECQILDLPGLALACPSLGAKVVNALDFELIVLAAPQRK